MNNVDKIYLDVMQNILENGNVKSDRTNTGTYSIFGTQSRFDLNEGFPILTTKKVGFNLIKSELLWFISGNTNIRFLLQNNNHIWDEWCFEQWIKSDEYKGPDMENFGHRVLKDKEFKKIYEKEMERFCEKILTDDEFSEKYGNIGAGAYGKQWRSFGASSGENVDQLKNVIEMIKKNPDSRRLIVSAWNPIDVEKENMLLPPCHTLFQFYVSDGKLSCQLYQRSGDYFLGIPFNIASYSLLIHMIAKECGLKVGEFIHTIGDAHIYSNHLEQAKEQLGRKEMTYELPTLWLNPEVKSIFDYTMDDIKLEGYKSHKAIKAPIAV